MALLPPNALPRGKPHFWSSIPQQNPSFLSAVYPQFDAVDWKNAANSGILWRKFSGSPASSSNIFQRDCSDSRFAKTHPAGPEPTIMKSYSWSVGFLPGIFYCWVKNLRKCYWVERLLLSEILELLKFISFVISDRRKSKSWLVIQERC